MTKLVVVLAAVVVIILIVVIVAARNMRAEDPDEFAERPADRDVPRGGRGERDAAYDRPEPAAHYPGRGVGGPSAGGPSAGGPSAGGPSAGRPGASRPGTSRPGTSRSGAPAAERRGTATTPGRRPAAAERGFDDRGDQWVANYDEPAPDRALPPEPEFSGRGYDDHISGPLPAAPPGPRRRPDNRAAPAGRDGRDSQDNGWHSRPDERPQRPVPTGSRQGRTKRPSDSSEWDHSDWEQLSDVDYWAELASDKTLKSTAKPAASAQQPRPAQRPGQGLDAETQTLASRGNGHGGAPRRDSDNEPTVRARRPPAGGELAGTTSRADFSGPPPGTGPRGGPQVPGGMLPAPPGERGARHSGPPSMPGRPGGPGRSGRSGRVAASGPSSLSGPLNLPPNLPGPSSLPEFPELPDPPSPPPSSRLPSSRASSGLPPAPGPAAPRGHRRPDPADDPLTSPSFPRVPADSRSYRNGRSGTASRSAASPQQYPALPTEQFSNYQAAPQRPAAQYGTDPGRDAGHADPYGYQPRLASGPESYPAAAPSAPPRPATAGNPYGSYVTPDGGGAGGSSGYGQYDAGQSSSRGNGNGHGYPPSAAAGGNGMTPDSYRTQQYQAPGAGSGVPGYSGNSRPFADPLGTSGRETGYSNGYGQNDQAGYQQGGYPAAPGDPDGYPPQDAYQGDRRESRAGNPPRSGNPGYGGYPGYGTDR
jgi:hypothetical protein